MSKIGFGLQSYWSFRYRDAAGNLVIIGTSEFLVLTQKIGILRRNALNQRKHILPRVTHFAPPLGQDVSWYGARCVTLENY